MSTRASELFMIWICLGILFSSCSGGKKQNARDEISQAFSKSEQLQSLPDELKKGFEVYTRYCLSCHQIKGTGVTGMYPPLAGNPDLRGQAEPLIRTVLQGRSGKIEVNRKNYTGVMPPNNFLADQQVADVLNYIRSMMNNFKTPITAKEVALLRKNLNQ